MDNQIITKDSCINRDFIAYATIAKDYDCFGFVYHELCVVVPGIYDDPEDNNYVRFCLYKNRSLAEVEKALKEYYEGRTNWEDTGSVEPTEVEAKFNEIVDKQGYIEICYRTSYGTVETHIVKKDNIEYGFLFVSREKRFELSDYGKTWALTEEELTEVIR